MWNSVPAKLQCDRPAMVWCCIVYTALVVRQGRYGVVLYGVYSPGSETGPLWCGAVWCVQP